MFKWERKLGDRLEEKKEEKRKQSFCKYGGEEGFKEVRKMEEKKRYTMYRYKFLLMTVTSMFT